MRLRLRNASLFLLMVLIWASNWSVMKRALSVAPPFTFVLHRFLLSLAALVVMLPLVRPVVPKDQKTLVRIAVLSLLNVGSFAATNIGLSSYSSGTGAVLTYTQPLMVYGLAAAFLNEKTSHIRLAGTILGFAGVSVLFFEPSSSLAVSLPAAVMILGAFFWAANTVYYKRFLNHVDPVLLNVLQAAIGLPLLASFSLALERPAIPFSASYIGALLYAGIGASAVGTTLWFYLLRDEDATALAGSSFIVPIMALVFGWWLLGENLDARSVLGSAFVLAGVYLVNRRTGKREQPTLAGFASRIDPPS